MELTNIVLKDEIKFLDGKKWKKRICIIRNLASANSKQDILSVELYKKDKNESANLILRYCFEIKSETYFGMRYSSLRSNNYFHIICKSQIYMFRTIKLNSFFKWYHTITDHMGPEYQFEAFLSADGNNLQTQEIIVYLRKNSICFTNTKALKTKILDYWHIDQIYKFGCLNAKTFVFSVEQDYYVLLSEYSTQIEFRLKNFKQESIKPKEELFYQTSTFDFARKNSNKSNEYYYDDGPIYDSVDIFKISKPLSTDKFPMSQDDGNIYKQENNEALQRASIYRSLSSESINSKLSGIDNQITTRNVIDYLRQNIRENKLQTIEANKKFQLVVVNKNQLKRTNSRFLKNCFQLLPSQMSDIEVKKPPKENVSFLRRILDFKFRKSLRDLPQTRPYKQQISHSQDKIQTYTPNGHQNRSFPGYLQNNSNIRLETPKTEFDEDSSISIQSSSSSVTYANIEKIQQKIKQDKEKEKNLRENENHYSYIDFKHSVALFEATKQHQINRELSNNV